MVGFAFRTDAMLDLHNAGTANIINRSGKGARYGFRVNGSDATMVNRSFENAPTGESNLTVPGGVDLDILGNAGRFKAVGCAFESCETSVGFGATSGNMGEIIGSFIIFGTKDAVYLRNGRLSPNGIQTENGATSPGPFRVGDDAILMGFTNCDVRDFAFEAPNNTLARRFVFDDGVDCTGASTAALSRESGQAAYD